MKVTKWLKLVALFPMTLLIGNIGDFAATGDEGSDDANEGEGSEGAGPDADESDEDQEEGADEGEEDETGDSPEGEEEEKGKPGKKSAQERIQQLANEKRELAEQLKSLEQRIAANEAKVQATVEDRPDYIEIDRGKVNAWLKEINGKIDEAELEDDLITAEELRAQKAKALAEVKEEEAKKKAWEARQNQKKTQTTDAAKTREEFDRTAEAYRQEMKVDPDTWTKMGKWFEAELNRNPLLGEEFNDTFARSGKVAAIRFAHQYTVQHMGAKEKAAIDAKKSTKDKTAKLSGSAPSSGANGDWKKEYSKLIGEGTEDAYVAAQALKRKYGGK